MNDKPQLAALAVHALYSGGKPGYMYTRYGNPTVHALAK